MAGAARLAVAAAQGCSVPLRAASPPLLRSDIEQHSATLRSLAQPPAFALQQQPCARPAHARLHL